MFDSYLKHLGILGNNRRISQFILPKNVRADYPLVDDKIKTDLLMRQAGLPTPQNYFTIEKMSDTRNLHPLLKNLDDFVVKPARGAMGNGIMIIEGLNWSPNKKDTKLMATRQKEITYSAFLYYISSILSGLYSLSGQPDRVLVQQRLRIHPFFKDISYQGIPDIRVIVVNGFPVMAMVRLPTEASGGRGNLHQGAVGCGVNLQDGRLIAAVQQNRLIEVHPDCQQPLVNLQLPSWKETLLLATRCSELVRIGYLGVDIVIHPTQGPLLLEMNARPGLSIQLANKAGLIPRLMHIENSAPKNLSSLERVEYSQSVFNDSFK